MATREEYERRRMELADHILEHPEEFRMEVWGVRNSCGTTGCLAGTAAMLAEKQGLCTVGWDWDSWGGRQQYVMAMHVETNAGRRMLLAWFARDYLGLESTTIFYAGPQNAELAVKRLLKEPYVEE